MAYSRRERGRKKKAMQWHAREWEEDVGLSCVKKKQRETLEEWLQ